MLYLYRNKSRYYDIASIINILRFCTEFTTKYQTVSMQFTIYYLPKVHFNSIIIFQVILTRFSYKCFANIFVSLLVKLLLYFCFTLRLLMSKRLKLTDHYWSHRNVLILLQNQREISYILWVDLWQNFFSSELLKDT